MNSVVSTIYIFIFLWLYTRSHINSEGSETNLLIFLMIMHDVTDKFSKFEDLYFYFLIILHEVTD